MRPGGSWIFRGRWTESGPAACGSGGILVSQGLDVGGDRIRLLGGQLGQMHRRVVECVAMTNHQYQLVSLGALNSRGDPFQPGSGR